MQPPPPPNFLSDVWDYAQTKDEYEISIPVVLSFTLKYLKNDVLEVPGGCGIIRLLQDLLFSPCSLELEILWELQRTFKLLKMYPSSKYFIIDDLLVKVNQMEQTLNVVELNY